MVNRVQKNLFEPIDYHHFGKKGKCKHSKHEDFFK